MGESINPRILIVESYGSNTKSILTHLAGSPFPLQIVSVSDAEAATTLIQKEPIDLAIIDTCLRGKMDGFDLCRALRSSASTQQLSIILLLSGYLSLERSKGISAGEELLRMIQLLLAEELAQVANTQPTAGIPSVRRLRSVS